MRPSRRRLIVLLAVLCAGLLILVVVSRVGAWLVPDFVEREASAALGQPVQVGSVGIVFRPGPRVRARDISIGSGPSAGAAVLRLAWSGLLRGEAKTVGVRLEGAKLALVRRQDGSVNVRGLELPEQIDGSTETGAAGSALSAIPPVEVVDSELLWIDHTLGPEPVTRTIAVKRARLRDLGREQSVRFSVKGVVSGDDKPSAKVSISGSAGPFRAGDAFVDQPFQLELDASDLEASWVTPYLPASWEIPRAAGPLELELQLGQDEREEITGELEVAIGEGFVEFSTFRFVGPAKFESGLHWAEDELTLTKAELESASASRLERDGGPLKTQFVEQLRTQFAYADETLRVESLDAKAYGGTLTHDGSIHFGAKTRVDIETKLAGAVLSELVHVTENGLPAASVVAGEIHLQGPIGEPRALRGSGTLSARGGEVLYQGLTASVGKALTSFVPAWARRKGPKVAVARTKLKGLTFPFTLENGRARTETLEIVTDDYHLKGRGELDIVDRSLDFDIEVAFTAQGTERIVSYASSTTHLSAHKQLPSLPVHVSGSLDEVHFRAKLGAAPLASVAGVLWGADSLVGATTGVVKGAAGLIENPIRRILPKASD